MRTIRKSLVVCVFCIVAPFTVSAQDLELKLAQQADFTPPVGTVCEQLVQVAQYYKIPMGIECVVQSVPEKPNSAKPTQSSVLGLLKSILRTNPNYSLNVRNGVVNVSHAAYVFDSRNFLNLTIAEFRTEKTNVYGAEAQLRFKIDKTLHPELYLGGYNGGYGSPAHDESGLEKENISISIKDVTVREVLNQIILQNGNSLWVVNVVPSRMMDDQPFFAQFDARQDANFYWKIIPFSEPTRR